MLKEELCKSSERFLQAVAIFSDKTIKVWKDGIIKFCKDKEIGIAYTRFLNWTRKENEVAVVTTYAYADFTLPKQFDCIFSYDNAEVYVQTKFTLTHSVLNGWYPTDTIDHGHKHLCVLRFEKGIPDILNRLHYESEQQLTWTWDTKKVLGLCQLADIQNIIDKQHKETKLQKLQGENWYDFDDQTNFEK